MAVRKIIIDTDPGQDDAVAILLALASDELDVLGLSIVAGNVGLHHTTRNAAMICELAQRPDLPIFAGCAAPLARPLVTAEHVHGKTGLDGVALPEPQMPLQDRHAVDFIIETLRAEPVGTITLCALGPLSNLASAFQRAPDIAARVAQIVLMGGAYSAGGNVTPCAEFNIFVDPEAAATVLACGAPIVMMPLDLTHQALTSKARVAAFRDLGTAAGHAVASWTSFFDRYDARKYGQDGAPLHDPCVIAYLLQPELFSGRDINVMVETQSPLTLGMTVADWWGATKRPTNVTFMTGLDAEGFFALLTERIALF